MQPSPDRAQMNLMLGTATQVDPAKSLGYAPRPVIDDPPPTCRIPPPWATLSNPGPTRRQRKRSARPSSPSGTASSRQPSLPPDPRAPPPAPPPPLSEKEIWWQDASAPLPARIWLNNLHKKAARHVRLPRSAMNSVPGSQHPKYTIENSPFSLVKAKCLEAGLILQGEERKKARSGSKTTTWRGMGPMTAFNFCQVEKYKQLGMGSGALKAPVKGQEFSDVLTFAIPPITVVLKETEDEWTAKVDHYLAVYNSSDLCTLPNKSNEIYKGQDPTEVMSTFKQTAQFILGEMLVRSMPMSEALKSRVPREYSSGDSMQESESESESVEEDKDG